MIKAFVAKKLFDLISKHGMKFVLQGLIEVCDRQSDNDKMRRLSEDLTKALTRFEGKK